MKNKNITIGSVLIALGVIIPSIFHFTGISGKIFLPMHIPVLIGGLILNPIMALIIGAVTPLLNSMLTGMPPFYPIGIIMIFELAVYGLLTSLVYKKTNLFIALISGMIGGRIIAAGVVSILQLGFGLKMNPYIYIKGAITLGLPGIVLQVILVPIIVNRLKKNGRVF